MDELASVIIVTYNCKNYLKSCLDSVLAQDYPLEIILVDNASEDGTVEYIRSNYSDLKIIETGSDLGYGAGNNVGFNYASGKYIVILNPDTIVHKNWLRELLLPISSNNRVITTSKILMWNGDKINTFGNSIHFTGLSFTTCLNEPATNYNIIRDISAISGASFALTKDAYSELNGFDENIFLYNEDAEISWKACLLNYQILAVPTSILNHDYHLNVSANKIYNLEIGRYIILKKYYSRKNCILLLPSLLLAEILAIGYACKLGCPGIKKKIHAIIDGSKLKISPVDQDKKILCSKLDVTIPTNQLTSSEYESSLISAFNFVFKWNWKLFLKLIK